MNNKSIAFTLVELLVVIAIIGILSGLIIVGMSSSVKSANLAKVQIFSSSLRDSLLANLVSSWKFDDSSNLGKDSWSSNDCTITGGATSQTSGCMYGNCLNLDGTTGYLNCGNGSNLSITNTLTIESWINLQSTGSLEALIDKNWGNGYSILISSSRAISGYYSGGGSPNYYTVSTAAGVFNWQEWAYIVYTFTTSSAKIYVNGIEKASKTPEGNIATNSTAVRIGVDAGVYYYTKGLVDELRIYNAAIPTSQTRENYYIGLNKLLSNGRLTMQDYHYRIARLQKDIALR